MKSVASLTLITSMLCKCWTAENSGLLERVADAPTNFCIPAHAVCFSQTSRNCHLEDHTNATPHALQHKSKS